MNIGELLGAMVQSGMSSSSNDRMKNSLGGGGVLDNLTNMLGGSSGQAGSGGGIADVLSSALGGSKGGGLMALLGAMAFNALKGSGEQKPQIPVGLLEPQTKSEQEQLEQSSELVLRAMINATKADGQIDESEINRLTGKLKEIGTDAEAQQYLMTQMQQPMETETLIAAAQGKSELAVQIYAASLLAIEVDTQAEKNYLDQLANGLGLAPQVTGRIQQMVGLQPA